MFLRVILFLSVLAGMILLIYSLLKEKEKPKEKEKTSTVFGDGILKKVSGVFIILFTLTLSFRYVKILPILLKVGLIFINFVIIYLVIKHFFNKQKTK